MTVPYGNDFHFNHEKVPPHLGAIAHGRPFVDLLPVQHLRLTAAIQGRDSY